MGYLLLILIMFIAGFIVSPIYSVIFGLVGLTLNSPFKIKFVKVDSLIFVYIIIISFFYMQLDNTDIFKEVMVYVFGPFTFYMLGKSNKKYLVNQEKILLLLFYIFTTYSLYSFFKDTSGFFSLNLDSNYYYQSRNKLVNKSGLDFVFLNETNFSLIILTSIILGSYVLKNLYIKAFTFTLLFFILLILASRTAVGCSVIVAVFYLWKFKSLKFSFLTFLSISIFFIVLFINIDLIEIPYISTFFKRAFNLDSSIAASSIDDRLTHFFIAIENTDSLFNIKGYKFLLNKFNFSSHNEFLGHTSAVGIIPAFFYFGILFSILKSGLNNLKKTNNILLYKIFSSLTICYFAIGITENLFVSNILWIYLYFLIIGITNLKNNHA
jgi:hypothetical protein